jgi:hypothetical protein
MGAAARFITPAHCPPLGGASQCAPTLFNISSRARGPAGCRPRPPALVPRGDGTHRLSEPQGRRVSRLSFFLPSPSWPKQSHDAEIATRPTAPAVTPVEAGPRAAPVRSRPQAAAAHAIGGCWRAVHVQHLCSLCAGRPQAFPLMHARISTDLKLAITLHHHSRLRHACPLCRTRPPSQGAPPMRRGRGQPFCPGTFDARPRSPAAPAAHARARMRVRGMRGRQVRGAAEEKRCVLAIGVVIPPPSPGPRASLACLPCLPCPALPPAPGTRTTRSQHRDSARVTFCLSIRIFLFGRGGRKPGMYDGRARALCM